ncbi:MAG: PAS domain-containing protein [Alphaproteobacteria bacterium]
MDRNRIILNTFEYWQSKLKGGRLPSRSDILPGELRDLLPFLFLADVNTLNPMGSEINLRLVGTHIERALGINLTGCPVGGISKHWKDFAVGRDFFDAANQRCAIAATHVLRGPPAPGKFTHLNEPAPVLRYHRLVLPLSCDGRRVDRLLGALVAETGENVRALWQDPFMFEEQAKRQLKFPFDRAARAYSSAAREHPVPAWRCGW